MKTKKNVKKGSSSSDPSKNIKKKSSRTYEKKALSVFLSGVMAITATASFTGNSKAEVKIEQKDHPSYSILDGSIQTSTVYQGPVMVPQATEAFVGDVALKGYAQPNATVIVTVNGNKQEVVASTSGFFTAVVPALKATDVVTYQAKIGDKLSVVAKHVVAVRTTVTGTQYDTAMLGGTTIQNKGFFVDGATDSRYFRMNLYTHAFSEPYLVFVGGKMYLQVSPEIAPYIEKIEFSRDGFGVSEAKYTATLNTTELPGVPGVYELPLLSSQSGWMVDAFAVDKLAWFKFYVKKDTPKEITDNGFLLNTWARKRLLIDYS